MLSCKKPSDEKTPYSKFIVDKDSKELLQCPNGQKPVKSVLKKDTYTAKFDKEECSKCP